MGTMVEATKTGIIDLIKPSDVISRFKRNSQEMAEKLGKDPGMLKREMVAAIILIYEGKVNGETRFEVTFNEKDLPIIKGYK